ncbi:MAG: KamA family radical SAM protein [Polyangiaceae bacterium]|nr:KamA family radical SAM protein [Polyangiaceae bacterium]
MQGPGRPSSAEVVLPRADGADLRGRTPEWKWQLAHAVRSSRELAEHLDLCDAERAGAERAERDGFPLAITPYYLSLIDRGDPSCPIRRQVVPHAAEREVTRGDLVDPLGEVAHEVAPDLVQRYPDRALVLATDRCAVYCRFCTRSRMVGGAGGTRTLEHLTPAFDWLAAHPEVRDVIVSGGDPLTLTTDRLVAVIERLRRVESIETIRLATRVPVVLPQRITAELLGALAPYHPLWVMTHFNHPKELTPLARQGLELLANAGFPVMNQSVLLRGVNDDATVLAELFRGLVRCRARPYYLLQADPAKGTGHLRTPIATGVALMEQLWGRLSGIALPKLVVDTPGGFGKVPIGPDYVIARRPGVTRFRTPRGIEVEYFDPAPE